MDGGHAEGQSSCQQPAHDRTSHFKPFPNIAGSRIFDDLDVT